MQFAFYVIDAQRDNIQKNPTMNYFSHYCSRNQSNNSIAHQLLYLNHHYFLLINDALAFTCSCLNLFQLSSIGRA